MIGLLCIYMYIYTSELLRKMTLDSLSLSLPPSLSTSLLSLYSQDVSG